MSVAILTAAFCITNSCPPNLTNVVSAQNKFPSKRVPPPLSKDQDYLVSNNLQL